MTYHNTHYTDNIVAHPALGPTVTAVLDGLKDIELSDVRRAEYFVTMTPLSRTIAVVRIYDHKTKALLAEVSKLDSNGLIEGNLLVEALADHREVGNRRWVKATPRPWSIRGALEIDVTLE